MTDYTKITSEEVINRAAAMPTVLKMIYESDAFGFDIMKLADDKFLAEDEARELQIMAGLYMMKFMNEQDFSEEIAKNLYVDPSESDQIVEKIRDLISLRMSSASITPRFGHGEPKTKSVVSSPDIHPENIIDLKDLPR